MDWTQWKKVGTRVRALEAPPENGRFTFSDADIVLTWLWAVAHGRSIRWACRQQSWPIYVRRVARPSPSQMSRRLRSRAVRALIEALERALRGPLDRRWLFNVDGKGMQVARHSRDRLATFGGQYRQRGYKLHAICDSEGKIWSWRLTPMHCHEGVIAQRLVRRADLQGYLVGDANYDARKLYMACEKVGVQLVAPRRKSYVGRGIRLDLCPPMRRRAIEMLENDRTGFGRALMGQRRGIERVFARLEQRFGIGHIPAWIRGITRVRQWIHGVIILDLARMAATAGTL